jgi:hypothetical protein
MPAAIRIIQDSAVGVGEFILSEANNVRSREKGIVTISGNQKLRSGQVLTRTESGVPAPTASPKGSNVGNGTVGAITAAGAAKPGTYKLTFIEPGANGGAFNVEDPRGVSIGTGNVGTAFNSGGLGFTVADGATDFVAGDQFTITVQQGVTKYVARSGSGDADAILYNHVTHGINGDEEVTVFVRDCEVNSQVMVGLDQSAINQLAEKGIIVRS